MGARPGRRPGHDHHGGDAAAEPGQDVERACVRFTSMPASRAASGFPPMATVRRPKVVRLSSTQPTADDGGEDDHEQRARRGHRSAAMLMICAVDDLRPLVGDLRGQAAGGDQHGQRGDERHEPAVRDEHAVDQTDGHADGERGEDHADRPVACVAAWSPTPPASATSAPTDRSMPPPMITNVMPTVTTPMAEALHAGCVDVVLASRKRRRLGDGADHEQHDEHGDQAEVADAHGSPATARPSSSRARCSVSWGGRSRRLA